ARFVHRRRLLVLAASGVLLALSVLGVAFGGTLTPYQPPAGAESTRGLDLMAEDLPGAGGATITFLFSHSTMRAEDPAFERALTQALAAASRDPRVESVKTPYNAPAYEAARLISADGRKAIALVTLRDEEVVARGYYADIRQQVSSPTLQVLATGGVAINHDFEATLQTDLQRAEIVSLPFTLLLLLVVFGTVVAALLPLGVGILSVVGGVGGVLLLANTTDVSIYAMNIVTLIGLGVAIDYSLFLVNRFREELAHGRGTEDALVVTLATAGRATLFSGLTVAIGLAGLLFYHRIFFGSMGLAGTIVVSFAVLYALTFLPALLSLLGPRVNKLSLPRLGRPRATGTGFWHRLALGVMKRPLLVFVPLFLLLVAAGAPFLNVHLAGASIEQLPEDVESRRGWEELKASYPDRGSTPIVIVVNYPEGNPLAPERVGAVYDLSRAVAALPGVSRVDSIVDLDPNLTRADYQGLYQAPRDRLPPPVATMVNQTVGSRVVVLSVSTPHHEASDEARALVDRIRTVPAVADGEVLVTGQTATDMDVLDLVYEATPYAVAFVLIATYLLIMLQTGSLVLPAKAVVMNLLSITASFGAIVWIFQEGHFTELLAFTPSAIDPSLPVILFCIVFGLSMDYEVLLLSRIHEEYERTGDNTQAVAEGLEQSGRLITGAAAIMVVVFGSFALAEVVLIKSIGLGLAIAIAVDATVVRALIVPATMRLMGKWNWWGPRWLRRFALGL
ncbi:MAG TPA: MMPL family transporter, partial [Candidatus Thermoplasmatota archaeon]|nr:MMPL family transporter [Candidatus Thermoplasmatota archaeon]